MSEKDLGLMHKYDVKRVDDPVGKHDACRYFVLDPQHDPIAREALATYAEIARTHGYQALADDLSLWLDQMRTEPEPA